MVKTKNIDKLATFPIEDIYAMVRYEHAQTLACLIHFLPKEVTTKLLKMFTHRLRNDVVLRMVTCDGVDSKWIAFLDSCVGKMITKKGKNRFVKLPDPVPLFKDIQSDELIKILQDMGDYDPELSTKIQDRIEELES